MNQIDRDNYNNRLIMSGIIGMIEDEGMSLQEAYKRIDEIKDHVSLVFIEAQKKVLGKTE